MVQWSPKSAKQDAPEPPVLEMKGVNGRITFDGSFIMIDRSGFLGVATFGRSEKRIPLSKLTAVQLKPAGLLTRGFIQFTIGGGIERRSRLGRQSLSAASDENSVLFKWSQKGDFERLRDVITAALASPPSQDTSAAEAPALDPVDQLQRLAELRDQGIVTEEEFQRSKARLLSDL